MQRRSRLQERHEADSNRCTTRHRKVRPASEMLSAPGATRATFFRAKLSRQRDLTPTLRSRRAADARDQGIITLVRLSADLSMFEEEIRAIVERPFTSIFLLTLVMTLVMRKLIETHRVLNKPKKE